MPKCVSQLEHMGQSIPPWLLWGQVIFSFDFKEITEIYIEITEIYFFDDVRRGKQHFYKIISKECKNAQVF